MPPRYLNQPDEDEAMQDQLDYLIRHHGACTEVVCNDCGAYMAVRAILLNKFRTTYGRPTNP